MDGARSVLLVTVVLVLCGASAVTGTTAKEEPAGRQSKPVPDLDPELGPQDANKLKGYEYLKKYGYLSKRPTKDDSDGALPEEKAVAAIKRLQRFAGLPATGEIDGATLDVIDRPRCGVKDPEVAGEEPGAAGAGGDNASSAGGEGSPSSRRRRYIVAGPPYQWNKNHLTYKVVNYPGAPSTITPSQVDEDARRAFRLWSDVTPLTFRPVSDESEADIRLIFGRLAHTDVAGDPSFDGPGGTLAHAFSPNSNWGDTDGDVHFDEDEKYTHGVNHGVNFFYTVAHEIGHTLGLDHSDVPNSLMWPWGRSYTNEFSLPEDDINGIQSIYGANPNPPTVPPTKAPPPLAYCTTRFSSLVLIRGQIYAFSGALLWRFDPEGYLLSEPEGELSRTYFPKLPRNVAAGYERWFDGTIFFFKGRNYWMYKSVRASPPLFAMHEVNASNPAGEPDFPLPVAQLKLPNKISAALHVPEVGRTYLFKAKRTVVLDEFTEDRLGTTKTHLAFPRAPWFPTGAYYHSGGGYADLIYGHGQGADFYRFTWDRSREEFVALPDYPRDLNRKLLKCP